MLPDIIETPGAGDVADSGQSHSERNFTMDTCDCNIATAERHPQSETLDLIAQHFPKAAEFTLEKLCRFVKNHKIEPWQAQLKPGDHFAYFWECDDDENLEVGYAEILPFEEGARLVGGENPELSPDPHLRFVVRFFPGSDDDVTTETPWEAHVPLTPEQFERIRGVGFPTVPAKFIQALLEFERAKAVASTEC